MDVVDLSSHTKAIPVSQVSNPTPAWNLLTKYCECLSLYPGVLLFTFRSKGLEDQPYTHGAAQVESEKS